MHPEVYQSLREMPFSKLEKIDSASFMEWLTNEKKLLEKSEADKANSSLFASNPISKILVRILHLIAKIFST